MTLEELRAKRLESQANMNRRITEGKTVEVIVGMGTCGIAAGGKDTLAAFAKELDALNVADVILKQTGCMGLCYAEPTVEVRVPGMPDAIYGRVDPAVAREIVISHIMERKFVEGHLYDRPATDILGGK